MTKNGEEEETEPKTQLETLMNRGNALRPPSAMTKRRRRNLRLSSRPS